MGGKFSAGVEALLHEREEGIFYLPHPSGRLLIGVFANNLKSADYSTPSEILVVDPGDLKVDAIGSFDLGTIDPPCRGGWRLEALDPQADNIAVACDGSESVAVLHLPQDLGTTTPTAAAAAITACGLNLGGVGQWTTQFVVADECVQCAEARGREHCRDGDTLGAVARYCKLAGGNRENARFPREFLRVSRQTATDGAGAR